MLKIAIVVLSLLLSYPSHACESVVDFITNKIQEFKGSVSIRGQITDKALRNVVRNYNNVEPKTDYQVDKIDVLGHVSDFRLLLVFSNNGCLVATELVAPPQLVELMEDNSVES